MKIIKLGLTILVIMTYIFTGISCKREKITIAAEESASDESVASTLFDDAFNQTENVMALKLNGLKLTEVIDTAACAVITITHDTDNIFPKIITIDFGTGCTDSKGVVRSGKIIVSVTGFYRTTGAVRTITFSNYKVNKYAIEGTKTVTNMGQNGSGQTYFVIKVENGKITTPDGKIITWTSDRVRTWVQGEQTRGTILSIFDDVYEITGSSKGIGQEGQEFEVTITKALQIQVGCRYIQKGELTVKVDNNPEVIIDYGDGACDAKATVTYKKKTKEITLRGN